MRISKESIFTGLNNLRVLSVADVKFDEYFGFTDTEVKELLECTVYHWISDHERKNKWKRLRSCNSEYGDKEHLYHPDYELVYRKRSKRRSDAAEAL